MSYQTIIICFIAGLPIGWWLAWLLVKKKLKQRMPRPNVDCLYKHKKKGRRYQFVEICKMRNDRRWLLTPWRPKWVLGVIYTGSGLVFVRSLVDFNKNFVEV